jgi:hypothetical protein
MGREALRGCFGTMGEGSGMLLSLCENATTTPAMRRAIREAEGTS